MIKVDLEEIELIMKMRKRINEVLLSEIEWYENGEKLDINKEEIEDFEFTGLNNIDFVTTGWLRKAQYKHE
jgi:hypothetical protein